MVIVCTFKYLGYVFKIKFILVLTGISNFPKTVTIIAFGVAIDYFQKLFFIDQLVFEGGFFRAADHGGLSFLN